ncbi:MAG: hypothetical protein BMS9Abin02_0850 [Anaerolineae bacterium]|nr:MAG: hypothetical protein BMS9Abin02_0850 [Anaerolineae bacterium]
MLSFIELIEQFWMNLQQGQLPQLGSWNYLLLASFIIWQGPVATILGGAAASAGLFQPGLVFIVAISTNLSADILWYTIGRRGNVDRLFKQDGRFSRHQHRYLLLQEGMRQHATKILLLAKLSAGFALPTLIAAGLSGLSWRRWFPVVFIGETIWTGTLILIGYFFTEAVKQVEHGLQLIIVAFSFLFLLIIVWFIPRQMRNSELFSVTTAEENKSP